MFALLGTFNFSYFHVAISTFWQPIRQISVPYTIVVLTVRPSGAQTRSVESLIERYLERSNPFFQAELRPFRTAPLLLAWAAERQKRDAAAFWLADLGGLSIHSEAFAERIRQARDGGQRSLLLGVGPADGWDDRARAQADCRFSLGPMTLPHELATLVLAEQVYRASTILQGHPYHLGH